MSNTGTLYVVATPIGNLGDITMRALEVLRSVDIIAAEDTRHTRKLLQHFGITTQLLSLHQHNEENRVPEFLNLFQTGKSIALVSDAGTPLLSDPGYILVKHCYLKKIKVIPVPGPSAITAALSATDKPTNRFLFEGFLPAKPSARRQALQDLTKHDCTIVLFESSHRIINLVEDMIAILGPTQNITIARELTKQYETFLSGSASELLLILQDDANQTRGEFVVILSAPELPQDQQAVLLKNCLETLLEKMPLKEAVTMTTKITGIARNTVYAAALDITKKL